MAKILVIDDNEEVRLTLQAMLERAGHETVTASDGREGLQRGSDASVDVVLLDVWMPNVDGITALKDLQAKRPNLPVIVMSGGTEGVPLEYSSALADAHGAANVLFKPFRKEELYAALDAALES